MIMNSEDEKFFEDLSGAKTEADNEYDVELVEVEAAAPFPRRPPRCARRSSAPKTKRKIFGLTANRRAS